MRLFEKHKNGAVIDIDGEAAVIAQHLVDWRAYQDLRERPKGPSGFVPEEKDDE